MFSEEDLAKSLNKIKDNLWIGDTDEARKLSTKMLDNTSETKTSEEYRAVFVQFRDQYVKLREQLKEKYSKSELDYLLSKRFSEIMIESAADPKDAIIGSILEYMISIAERLEGVEPPLKIKFGEKFKYSILNLGNRYEVRMLLSNGVFPNIEKMLKQLNSEDFRTHKIIEAESYSLISAFSSEAYIEIVVFVPRIEFSIALSSPSQEKAEKISKTLAHSLVSEG